MRDPTISPLALIEQRQLIDKAARIMGTTRATFIMEAACDKAQSLLLSQTLFEVSEEQFHAFQEMLDAPPTPNPGLERLMRSKPPWAPGKHV